MDWATNRRANSEWIPLLTTKLHVARTRPNLVHRPRLVDKLDEGLRTRLTLVAAPAGFGKTTLVSGWAQRGKQNVAWLSLDESDNVPVRFWAYFIGSLQRLQPGLGVISLELLQQGEPVELALTALINELAAIPGEVAMVLDDYHQITLDPIHSTLNFFLERMPAQMHMYIIARIDPPLQLTRLRARGELVEVRAADLRFTPQEAATLFSSVSGVEIPGEEIAEITDQTEGWAVGLQLTALAIQEGRRGNDGKISTGRYRYVAEYILEEVLRRMPEDLQHFLLRTSILERLDGEICDAVTGNDNGDAMLAKLLSTNLFVVPLEGEPEWHRYHTLFAQVLRDQMEQTDPEELAELHRRASGWFEAHDAYREAVDHLLMSNDVERAVVLAERYAETILAAGKLDALLRWRAIFPEDLVAAKPRLALAFGWALLLTGQFEDVEKYLELGNRFAPPRPDSGLSDISGHIAAMQNMLAGFRSGAAKTEERGEYRAEGTEDEESARKRGNDKQQKGFPPVSEAIAPMSNGTGAEKQAQTDVETLIAPKSRFSLQSALPRVARLQFRMGKLGTAAATYHEALDLLEEHVHLDDDQVEMEGWCYIGLGEVDYERNQLDAAMRHITEGIRIAREVNDPALMRDAYVLLSQVHQTRGDLDGASDAIDEAEASFRKDGISEEMLASLAPHRVRIWLAQGNLQCAAQWAQREMQNSANRTSDWYETRQLTLARVLIAQYRSDDALELLAPLLANAEAKHWNDTVIRTLLLQSLALDQQGEGEQATLVLLRALQLAEPESYIRVFANEGGPMIRLLMRLKGMAESDDEEKRIELPGRYVDALLAGLGVLQEVLVEAGMKSSNGTTNGTTHAELPTPISDREIEVLKLIADGKSNASIADTLYISLSTVKTHINNLYSKLGVESRTQALARAREYNLI